MRGSVSQITEWLRNPPEPPPISEKEAWVFDECRGVQADAFEAYRLKYSILWELRDKIDHVPILVGIVGGVYPIWRYRGELEETLVISIAGTIRGKRRVGSYFKDVKARIAKKVGDGEKGTSSCDF